MLVICEAKADRKTHEPLFTAWFGSLKSLIHILDLEYILMFWDELLFKDYDIKAAPIQRLFSEASAAAASKLTSELQWDYEETVVMGKDEYGDNL